MKSIDLTGIYIRKPFCKQFLDPALMKNITLQKVEGKFPANIIDGELELNKQIEKEIVQLYKAKGRISKHMFDLNLVESNK